MTGETDLQTLLTSMSPALMEGDFVFLSFAGAVYGDHAELDPVASFLEPEGLTLVVEKSKAVELSLNFESVYKCITLKVHSSLEAVGLTAAFASKLSDHGISANVIAGYYHDHIFVLAGEAQKTVSALNELSQDHRA